MYTRSQLCFREDIYIYSYECDFNCGKYGAYFHVLSVHSNERTPKGNGLLCSVQVDGDWHPFLLTCSHILLKEEENRAEMTKEACIDAICRNLRCEKHSMSFWAELFWKPKKCQPNLWSQRSDSNTDSQRLTGGL